MHHRCGFSDGLTEDLLVLRCSGDGAVVGRDDQLRAQDDGQCRRFMCVHGIGTADRKQRDIAAYHFGFRRDVGIAGDIDATCPIIEQIANPLLCRRVEALLRIIGRDGSDLYATEIQALVPCEIMLMRIVDAGIPGLPEAG